MLRCSACGVARESIERNKHSFGQGDELLFCHKRAQDATWEEFSPPEPDRISRDDLFFEVARSFAKRSTCPRAHVGCVIVQDRRIVATGYNGSPPGTAHCTELGCLPGPDGGCIRTTHAEINAIVWAARSGVSTSGAHLYCTHEPCLACAKAIVTAGILGVHFIEPYRQHMGIELLRQVDVGVIG